MLGSCRNERPRGVHEGHAADSPEVTAADRSDYHASESSGCAITRVHARFVR